MLTACTDMCNNFATCLYFNPLNTTKIKTSYCLGDNMEYIFTYIANYGFPMVVASFLLFRMDKHLANLEEGIRHMNETLAKQVNH